ncbi:MAG: 2Fe-2S iron-sulfur cluster-binding protein [Hyphomonas sp.]|uniref:2Fe-2S iron-sulfur cluster-binding protein n=1 Tax=Hyphomonas sp. TaxID=87 RepID=UPI0030013059
MKIIFVAFNGDEKIVDASVGQSLMQAAVANDVRGIDADCGGACACATCHVYIEQDRFPDIGARAGMEASMLEFAENVKPNSRLACQIPISVELEGVRIFLPEAQH